jgi:hypothetical protein
MNTTALNYETLRHGGRNQGRDHPTLPVRARPPSRQRRRALAALAVALAAAGLALAGSADAQAVTINVNPLSGSDANPGTATAPLKTLTKALSNTVAGDTVKLAGGGYGQSTAASSSGEQIPGWVWISVAELMTDPP